MKTDEMTNGKGLLRRPFAIVASGGLIASALVAASSAQAADNAGLYEILSAPTGSQMLDADPAPTPLPDPEGNVKELGPVNSNETKLGVIHTAAVPMLDFTNPNAQVDLRDIWLGTSTDPADGDQWLYFAWERDSAKGSGTLMIEFQQAPLSAACDYDAQSFDPAACNPWSGRQAGDFFLVWDQQGQDIAISKRTFALVEGELVLDGGVDLTSSKAAVSDDGFFGEAAVNLTDDVFGTGVGSCTTLANVIPGTVTGNSDTADYKDTVLAKAPPISNCGTVTVSKVTVPPGDTDTSFSWTLDRADGSNINYDPVTSTGDSIKDGQTQTVNDLIAADNYNLAEADPGPKYALDSIVCTDAGGTEYDATDDGNFPVNAGETTACVITNDLQPGTLIVEKVLVQNNGGQKSVTDFSFTRNGGEPDAFEADGENSYKYPANTEVDVVEVSDPGYATKYSNSQNSAEDCQDLIVPAGGSVKCTITNNDKPGTLIVQKVVVNNNGGTKTAGDFSFQVNGGDLTAFNEDAQNELAGQNTIEVDKGTYTVTEPNTVGYFESFDNCADVAVDNGATQTCVVTNDDMRLIVNKVVDNGFGGTNTAGDFAFQVDGSGNYPFVEDESDPTLGSGFVAVEEGEHTATEVDSLGYDVNESDCAAVTVPEGGEASCTIVNTYPKALTAVITEQSWVLRDSAEVTMRTGGSASDITFTVFDTVAQCEAYVADPTVEGWLWNSGPVPVTEGEGVGSAETNGVGNHGGYLATSPGDYYWLAEFSGNTFNEPSNSQCGAEITVINATDTGQLPE